MTGMVRFTIDQVEISAREGSNVLEAALNHEIYIPHLCHHPDLKPVGACRLCGVEVDGRTSMACLVPVADGMAVRTDTETINETRRVAVELLIANHHMECLSCGVGSQCELLRIADHVGVDRERLARLHRPEVLMPVDSSNPFFSFDPNKCVLCGICVRTCEEIVGLGALDYVNRGYRSIIGTFGSESFVDSICESCGECVVRCPVGALAPKMAQRPSREVKTTCVYCGVGCGIFLGVKGDQIVSVRADRERPTNEGSLCVKGRYGFKFINHRDRLKAPLIRRNGEFVESSWDEALDLVASKFKQSKGGKFAALASAKCTNEENYLIQKFTRVAMETNTVDHCARL